MKSDASPKSSYGVKELRARLEERGVASSGHALTDVPGVILYGCANANATLNALEKGAVRRAVSALPGWADPWGMRLDRTGRKGLEPTVPPDSVWLFPLPRALIEASRYPKGSANSKPTPTVESMRALGERHAAFEVLAPARSKEIRGGVPILLEDLSVQRVLDAVTAGLPNEVDGVPGDSRFPEGHARQVWVNKYERSAANRNACLEHHKAICVVCDFESATDYPAEVGLVIHVHHRIPLSTLQKEYVPDPIMDLCPVCPNCHAAIHSRPGKPFTPEELRALMKLPPRR